MNKTLNPVPLAILTAIDHVKTFFPEVAIVVFNDVGRWQYMGENFEHVSFEDTDIDISLLENASDAAYKDKGFPCVYQVYSSESGFNQHT